MYKKKIVYFPEDGLPRIYVNPKDEALLLRTYRAVHLTPEKEKELAGHPLHKWEFNIVTKNITINDDLGELRKLDAHKYTHKDPNTLTFSELLALFLLACSLSAMLGYMIGFSYKM